MPKPPRVSKPLAELPSEGEALVRTWQRRSIAVGLLLPWILPVELLVMAYFPDGPLSMWFRGAFISPPPPIRIEDVQANLILGTILYTIVDWPFLAVALQVRHRVRRLWPNKRAAKSSLRGGLIGMTVPYLFGFASAPMDFLGMGVAVAYLLALFCPIVGWGLALFGFWAGASNNEVKRS